MEEKEEDFPGLSQEYHKEVNCVELHVEKEFLVNMKCMKRVEDVIYFVMDFARGDHFLKKRSAEIVQDTEEDILEQFHQMVRRLSRLPKVISQPEVLPFINRLKDRGGANIRAKIEGIRDYLLYFFPMVHSLEIELLNDFHPGTVEDNINWVFDNFGDLEVIRMKEALLKNRGIITSLLLDDLRFRLIEKRVREDEHKFRSSAATMLSTVIVTNLVLPILEGNRIQNEETGTPTLADQKIVSERDFGEAIKAIFISIETQYQNAPELFGEFENWVRGQDFSFSSKIPAARTRKKQRTKKENEFCVLLIGGDLKKLINFVQTNVDFDFSYRSICKLFCAMDWSVLIRHAHSSEIWKLSKSIENYKFDFYLLNRNRKSKSVKIKNVRAFRIVFNLLSGYGIFLWYARDCANNCAETFSKFAIRQELLSN
jgi:hypothetical protein